MLPGECRGGDQTECPGCGATLNLKVCMSGAGYYHGYFCNQCGPISRESGYFKTREEAERELPRYDEHSRLPGYQGNSPCAWGYE